MVRQVESKDEYDQVVAEAGDKLIVIDFYATWCGPCKLMGPKFEKMEDEFEEAMFLKIDIDEAAIEEVVDEMDIKVMPTFILIKKGNQLARLEGNVPDQLRAAITENK